MEILGIGPMELLLVLIIALMVFGPDKLPEIGAKLGRGLRSVRSATREFSREIEETRQAIEAPLNEIKAPLAELTQPINEIKQPFQDLKQPFEDLKQPFEDLRNPLRELGNAAQQLPGQATAALTAAATTINTSVTTSPLHEGSATVTEPEGQASPPPKDLAYLAEVDETAGTTAWQLGTGADVLANTSDDSLDTTVTGTQDDDLARPPAGMLSLDQLANLAPGVINPHEALRQVIARQMRPEPRVNP